MPKGHAARREKKKVKKKAERPLMVPDAALVSPEVEVIRKKREPRKEEAL